jgi:hypothetical protein
LRVGCFFVAFFAAVREGIGSVASVAPGRVVENAKLGERLNQS